MPLQATSGAASYDAFGGGAAAKVNYIEDFFQSYLRTGTGASATVTTGLDGSTKETLVWTKSRSAATNHKLTDNVRGATKALSSNTTGAEATDSQGLTAFSATGYTLGTNTDYNNSGATYVDWQWIAQPKFFDVVTWSGDGTGNRAIPHSLGSTPSFITTKHTNGGESWWSYHRSVTSPNANWWRNYGILNGTNAFDDWGDNSGLYQEPDATNLYIGSWYNASGKTYVAYLFAHNAGGFGLTGTDNVISCGSVTTNSLGLATVDLGYEPQWILYKSSAADGNWNVMDNMRGLPARYQNQGGKLFPNLSNAETNSDNLGISATGFTLNTNANEATIYIAIRRGPMKVPTSGTSVFNTVVRAGTGTATSITGVGFPPDFMISHSTNVDTNNVGANDKLRGVPQFLATNTSGAEGTISGALVSLDQDGFSVGTTAAGPFNSSGQTNASWIFRRAPSFFDEVCYTTPGSTFQVVTHNLGVTPELIIVKQRNNTNDWGVQYVPFGSNSAFYLNTADAVGAGGWSYFFTSVTASSITATTSVSGYAAGTYVAYLFATCAGVSKVGSFTGNGTSQTIPCGFTSGARFVLIKKSSGTGDWMVSDSARGIVAGSDPYLELNNTNAEVAGEDWLDTDSTGFVVNEVSGSNANTSGATYIFLAIA